MRPHLRSLILAAALLVPAAAFVTACGESHDDAAPAAPKAARTDAPAPRTLAWELDQLVDAGSPGAIALVDDGHGIRLSAAGVADRRTGRPLRPTDRFRAGSNTKTFVATVALQLVAERKLSLSDTVEQWLPGILPYGDTVNLRQLLNMTSGIPDYVPELEAEMVEHRNARTQTY